MGQSQSPIVPSFTADHTLPCMFYDVAAGQAGGQNQLLGAEIQNAKVRQGVVAACGGDCKQLYFTHSGQKPLFDLARDSWETNDLIGNLAQRWGQQVLKTGGGDDVQIRGLRDSACLDEKSPGNTWFPGLFVGVSKGT